MNPVVQTPLVDADRWPVPPQDLPIMYEDEEEPDMGDANRHWLANEILHACLPAFAQRRGPDLRVFSNMNCYYLPGPPHPTTGSLPYFSADCMIVRPFEPLSEDLVSYTIDEHGPAPLVTIEVLSKRSAQQGDLKQKVTLYARLKIEEYILLDPSGKFLPQKLLLKQLQHDGTWRDERDADGGVTSKLGFRLILDAMGELEVIDAATDKRFVRPLQAEAEAEARRQAEELARREAAARQQAEERVRTLEAELERLRQTQNRDNV